MEIQQDRHESARLPVEEPRTKTTEVQTVFRESEAQTNPYTPDYIINKENVPVMYGSDFFFQNAALNFM